MHIVNYIVTNGIRLSSLIVLNIFQSIYKISMIQNLLINPKVSTSI